MNITRRGLMGMFAAGVGAAILPSGVIMPVKNILTWDDFITQMQAYDIYRDLWLVRQSVIVGRTQLHITSEITSSNAETGGDVKRILAMHRQRLIASAQERGTLRDAVMSSPSFLR